MGERQRELVCVAHDGANVQCDVCDIVSNSCGCKNCGSCGVGESCVANGCVCPSINCSGQCGQVWLVFHIVFDHSLC